MEKKVKQRGSTVTNPESKAKPVDRAIRMMAEEIKDFLDREYFRMSYADREEGRRITDLILRNDPAGRVEVQTLRRLLPWDSRASEDARRIALEIGCTGSDAPLRYETASRFTGISVTQLRAYRCAGRLQTHMREDGFGGYSPDELEALLRDIYRGDATGCDSLLFEPKRPWRAAADRIGAPRSLFKELLQSGRLFDIHGVLLERDVSQVGRLWHRHQAALVRLVSGLKPRQVSEA